MPVVDVIFTVTDLVQAHQAIVVVIDVLRASSTIVTALNNGCRAVIPVASTHEAQKTAAGQFNVLLAGERNALKPDHFDLGNSPLEYQFQVVQNKTIVLTTSNGTRAVKSIDNPFQIVVGSFLNVGAVIQFLNNQARDVLLYCAGTDGRLSLEDVLCAATVLVGLKEFSFLDGAWWTLQGAKAYLNFKNKNLQQELLKAISQSQHALRLKQLGFEKDVMYCSQLNKFDFVPFLKEDKFIK